MGMVSKKFEFHNLNHERTLYLNTLRNGMTEILVKCHRRYYVVRVNKDVASASVDICPCVPAKPTKNALGLYYQVYGKNSKGEESAQFVGVNNDMQIDRDFIDRCKEIEKANYVVKYWAERCKLYKHIH